MSKKRTVLAANFVATVADNVDNKKLSEIVFILNLPHKGQEL